MGMIQVALCFAFLFILGLLFEVFTVLLATVIQDSTFYAKSNSSEPMDDEGYIYSAMYLSMHDE